MTTTNGNGMQTSDRDTLLQEPDIDAILEEVLQNGGGTLDLTTHASKYIVSNGEGEVYYRLDEDMLFGYDEVAVLTLEEAYRVIEHVKESDGKTFLYRLVTEEIKDGM